MEDMIHDALDWMEDRPDAVKEDFLKKQKDVENVANPMIRKIYNTGGSSGGYEDEFDFGDDEL